jgi:hypothetical protein
MYIKFIVPELNQLSNRAGFTTRSAETCCLQALQDSTHAWFCPQRSFRYEKDVHKQGTSIGVNKLAKNNDYLQIINE